MDAANILKAALARGGACHWSYDPRQYQKYFEKDKALERKVPGGDGERAR